MRDQEVGCPWEQARHNAPGGHLYTHGAGTVHAVVNSNSGTAADSHAHGPAEHCDTHAGRHGDAHTGRHGDAHASTHSNAHVPADGNAHSYTHTVGNSHATAVTNGHADTGRYAGQRH